jgi:asparagine synthetase B (glutamine-hydrolysing)
MKPCDIVLEEDGLRNFSIPELADRTWELLKLSVEIAVKGHEHDTGMFLSGGLDSGLIAVACKELGYDIPTITVCYPERTEDCECAHATANHLGIGEWRSVVMHQHHLEDAQKPIREALGNGGIIAGIEQVWFAYERMRDLYPQVRHTLVGHGGDELYGGYPWQLDVPTESIRDKMRLLIQTNLAPLDYAEKHIASHVGVTVHQPFLDACVVGFASRLPLWALYDSSQTPTSAMGGKLILREIARKKLPEQVATMKKRGFIIPETWGKEKHL